MTITVQCPACGRELKLADRSFLGRKGKCPKCGNLFVLQEPNGAGADVPSEGTPVSPPPVSRPAPLPTPPEPEPASAVDWSEIVREKKVEKKEPPKEELDFSFLSNAPSTPETTPVPPPISIQASLPDFSQVYVPDPSAARVTRKVKKPTHGMSLGWKIAAGLSLVTVVAVILAIQMSPKDTTKNTKVGRPVEAVVKAEKGKPPANKPVPASADANDDAVDPAKTPYAELGAPTDGTPIEMFYIPFGTAMVISLHPADLWKDGGLPEEIRKCAPPLFELGESVIQKIYQCDPDDIDELLICLIPGTRGSLPEVAAVARMMQEQDDAPFFVRDGVSVDTVEEDVFSFGQRAYLLVDEKTIATCPQAQMDEMIQGMKTPNPAKPIDSLIPMTDHDRDFTVIVAPKTLALHEAWFPEKVRPFVQQVAGWMADDVEVFAWSLHCRSDLFYSEILLRNREGNSRQLEKTIPSKLQGLSQLVKSAVDQMKPTEQGKRMLIERLPAMIDVFSMATLFNRDQRHLQLITPLPDRAAPNLILAVSLAWEESTRTNFSTSPNANEGKKLPPTIAERLKLPIDVDFRASPMNESFTYIGGEIGTKFELDGDALKAGGFTKNLKQEFRMNAAPVGSVIQKIFEEAKGVDSNPEKRLVIVVDEVRKQVVVTTLAAAQKRGLVPTDLATLR